MSPAPRRSGPGLLGWLLVLLSLTALGMGLTLAWCNIERLDLAFRARQHQNDLDAHLALASKLEVERANLLSPYRLQEKAKELGMNPASSGRIRKLAAAEARP